jgi:hypothetical protein
MPGFFTAFALFFKELMLLVSYVKNNAFPQPLTEEEEEKHLKLMAEGKEASRNILIEHNLRLVAHIVKRLWTRNDVIFVGQVVTFPHTTHVECCSLLIRDVTVRERSLVGPIFIGEGFDSPRIYEPYPCKTTTFNAG